MTTTTEFGRAGVANRALQVPGAADTGIQESSPEAAMVQSPARSGDYLEGEALSTAVGRIPVEIDVAVPIRQFRVRNLLTLTTGQLIVTQWLEGEDLPLGARGAQLAWTEFEVLDRTLAVRITRLA